MSFSELLMIIHQEGSKFNPLLPMIGEVVNENPLQIKTSDMILDNDQLLIVETLIPDEKITLVPTGNQYEYTYSLNTPFIKGKTVVVIPTSHRNKFIVMRVVNA